jgi:hypothetical protein
MLGSTENQPSTSAPRAISVIDYRTPSPKSPPRPTWAPIYNRMALVAFVGLNLHSGFIILALQLAHGGRERYRFEQIMIVPLWVCLWVHLVTAVITVVRHRYNPGKRQLIWVALGFNILALPVLLICITVFLLTR